MRRLHNQIYAAKLQQMFQAPLVLVYQALGTVDQLGVRTELQARVNKAVPDADVRVELCHMKNTIAAATGDVTMQRLFNNSNVLLAFNVPSCSTASSPDSTQQPAEQQQQQEKQRALLVAQHHSLADIVGSLLEQPMPGPHLPQAVLRELVELGLSLPGQQPMVLLGAFYKRANTPLASIKRWIKLDASQVGRGSAAGAGY